MSNKTYDVLKIISSLIAPITVLVAALASIWNFPYGKEIVASLAAVDVFMGSVVVISKALYDKKKEGK